MFLKNYEKDCEAERKRQAKETSLIDLEGFYFNPKSFDLHQIKKDCNLLSKFLKQTSNISSLRKNLLKKILNNVKNKKLYFCKGLDINKIFILSNLSINDLYDLANIDKKSIMYRLFQNYEYKLNLFIEKEMLRLKGNIEELLESIKQKDISIEKIYSKIGLNETELTSYYSNIFSNLLVKYRFLDTEQHEKIYSYIKKSDFKIKNLIKKLEEILTDNQKEFLNKFSINIFDFARNIINYGRPSLYRYPAIINFIRENKIEIDTENKHYRKDIRHILKGKTTQNIKEAPVPASEINISTKNDAAFKKAIENLKYIEQFNNHNEIINTIENAKEKGLTIPNILVNFDAHSDIYADSYIGEPTLADWVNDVVIKNNITDVYWVVPHSCLNNPNVFNFYFGEEKDYGKAFSGNYDKTLIYRDYKKPLKQTFLIDNDIAKLVIDSVNYPQEKFDKMVSSSRYKIVNIYTCTIFNLPKMKENFILSLDADYFNNCGYDSNWTIEHLSINPNNDFNDFLIYWKKNLQKANIAGLCISPEYIGFNSIEITKKFYEYIINTSFKFGNSLVK